MTWSVVVLADGEPVTGAVPTDAWLVASVMGEWFAAWLGGPVSVGQAVAEVAPIDETPLLGLFAEAS